MHVPSDILPETGYITPENINTQNNLNTISEWTDCHQMKLNPNKTKYMIINFCTSYQFKTRLTIRNSLLEQVNQTKLLGVIIEDDLSWAANTKLLLKKAFSRMIILRKLVEFEVSKTDMITIYILFIRSVLEQSSVVWSSSLTQDELMGIERAQKVALRIIYQNNYISYENALSLSNLSKMYNRFQNFLLRFAIKCAKNDQTKDMLPLKVKNDRGRFQDLFSVPFARKERFKKSAIPTMARMLNDKERT